LVQVKTQVLLGYLEEIDHAKTDERTRPRWKEMIT
jgi:hypothetical protein